jgi:hypothetical protein
VDIFACGDVVYSSIAWSTTVERRVVEFTTSVRVDGRRVMHIVVRGVSIDPVSAELEG